MKFNKLLQRKSKRTTVNLAGGEAYAESPKLKLISMLLTSFLEDKFYRSGNDTVACLRKLANEVGDDRFVAKAALYARHEAGMRSVSHLIAGDLAARVKGAEWTKRFFDRIVRRPDDALEILAYSMAVHGKPLPNALKKGIGAALARFDHYQLEKYCGGSAELKLVDAVNLVHPPHTEALRALMNGTLAPAATWETGLTQAGQNAHSESDKVVRKAAAWTELMRSRKIGYFALLRNRRNILEQAPEATDDVIKLLTDRALIKRSLVLPFRFRTALDALASVPGARNQMVIAALSDAVDLPLHNVPRFDGRTLIAMDCSGSMIGRPMKIGSLFAAVLFKASDADMMLFSGSARYVALNKNDSTLTIASRIEEKAEWSGTNFHAVFDQAKGAYDRVIILSDMQAWIGRHTPKSAFDAYVARSGKRPRIYSFDLAGHGTLQFPEREVYALAGWSDKVLDTLKFLEQDKHALVREIENIEL
ncbi:MAG: TROVE domain-containing protein [Verrucomicrobiae bacterium]|nr:TROVE domain-containing protein [Verrucomicrobiae bacterium]